MNSCPVASDTAGNESSLRLSIGEIRVHGCLGEISNIFGKDQDCDCDYDYEMPERRI
jgi:hypothetical protein